MDEYAVKCQICEHENSVSYDYCHSCSTTFSNPFIVRRASLPVETSALNKAYTSAKQEVAIGLKEQELDNFERLVIDDAEVVINMPVDFAFHWVLRSKLPYMSYRKQIALGLRDRAELKHDTKRTLVESTFFGSRDIVYGALTVDETGLHSYGEVKLFLKKSLIENRAALLIENTFTFHKKLEKSKWTSDDPIPPGNMCTWINRHMLAVVKCKEQLLVAADTKQFPRFILDSSGDRHKDDFIEVHIESDIHKSMIEKIVFPGDMVTRFESKATSKDEEYLFQFEEIKNHVKVEISNGARNISI